MRDAPPAPRPLRRGPDRGQPSVDKGEDEEANACAESRAGRQRYPSHEPQSIPGREVQIRAHGTRAEVHGAVH